LIKLWGNISRATVQRTLQKLEQLGLLRRLTASAKKQPDGTYSKERKLLLLLPKSLPYLMPHSDLSPKLEDKPLAKNSTQSVKQKDFVDYLIDQRRVTKGAWAFWLRKNQAAPQTFGYLLGSIHQRIQNRPDVLENILFDGEEQKLKGKQLVGFTISESRTDLMFWRAFSLMASSKSSEASNWWALPSQKSRQGQQHETILVNLALHVWMGCQLGGARCLWQV